jgi:hypothetical protein
MPKGFLRATPNERFERQKTKKLAPDKSRSKARAEWSFSQQNNLFNALSARESEIYVSSGVQ